ncbi:MAG TPA: type I secretion system permease/ATPase [Pseudorhodoplanes sp.]|jgi:ATP-binding cassette subfamily C protein|nr:type I secretion system permease/ATPase [Pseudorhodoplanes sp.]
MQRVQPRPGPFPPRSELGAALAACRQAFISIAVFSGISNVLMLTGSIFMLEIYDRVLPSRSVPTLVGLSVLALVLFLSMGCLDLIRGRILVRVGASLDESLSGRVYETLVRLPLHAGNRSDGLQPLRDLDSIRSFLSGLGPIALCDLPWLPIYLAVCFAFHFWIGTTALIGAIILTSLTLLTEHLTKRPMLETTRFGHARNGLAEASQRNAEALAAMGMLSRIAARWHDANRQYMQSQRLASDVAGGLGAISKVLRMVLQSAVLAVGAYLVIYQQATAGIIIAGSILSARALAPVDLAIANWKGFVSARQGWARLTRLLAAFPAPAAVLALDPPSNTLAVEGISAAPPGHQKLVVQDISFTLQAGCGLGIIGPSASGKSSLARCLVGVWTPVRGKVRLDGAALDQWNTEALGAHIGYLPQDVELFGGTVAQNIARFEPDAPPEAIVAAAKAAGVHDLIVKLPEGYETQVGDQGTALSSGQAQRIALARALYGDPFLVVLDEPNSNLDAEGDEALTRAIFRVRERNGIVVVVAHRPSAISGVDHVLVMSNGRQQAFGPKDEVLARVLQRPALPRPLKIVPEKGGSTS